MMFIQEVFIKPRKECVSLKERERSRDCGPVTGDGNVRVESRRPHGGGRAGRPQESGLRAAGATVGDKERTLCVPGEGDRVTEGRSPSSIPEN